MEEILNLLATSEIRNIVMLIGLDVLVGILAALKTKEFALGKLAGFMKRGVLTYVLGFAVLSLVGQALPSLSMVVTIAYWLVILALAGSILDNVGKLGLPLPKMLRK